MSGWRDRSGCPASVTSGACEVGYWNRLKEATVAAHDNLSPQQFGEQETAPEKPVVPGGWIMGNSKGAANARTAIVIGGSSAVSAAGMLISHLTG